MENKTYPDFYTEYGMFGTISNLTFSVDEGAEEYLRNNPAWTRYAAMNFNGRVWFDKVEEQFCCEVWVYGTPIKTICDSDITKMMHLVSEEFGYD